MKKIYDETVLLNSVLKNGFLTGTPDFQELLVLAKNFRGRYGYGFTNICKELSNFCSGEIDGYLDEFYFETFRSVARISIKTPELRTPSYPIEFTRTELDKIRRIKNFKYQKVIFSALSLGKAFGNKKIISSNPKDISFILKISQTRISKVEFRDKVTPIAKQHGIFEHRFSKNGNGFYISILKEEDESIQRELFFDDLTNAGVEYKNYIGCDLGWCENCETEICKQSNRHGMCSKCAYESGKDNNRKRVSKHRDGWQ